MKALILVDIQNDFLPGGPLEVADGDNIIPVVNAIQARYDIVAATQDWHPANHASFASNHEGKKPFDVLERESVKQILWPDHCVWGSPGAAFAANLNMDRVAAVFRKGMDPGIDSYSGFFDNGKKRSTGLADWLKGMGIDTVHVAGLAAEICVAFTAEDAADCGFMTAVIEDGTRPLSLDDYEKKREALKNKDVGFIHSAETSAL